MKRPRPSSVAIAFFLVIAAVTTAHAQSTSATITGTIFPPVELLTPHSATVFATNQKTLAVLTTQTDSALHYRFSDLTPGAYRIVARAGSWFSTQYALFPTRYIEVKNSESIEINFELKAFGPESPVDTIKLHGNITIDNSTPLNGVLVSATSSDRKTIAVTNTRETGRYSFAHLSPGTYTIAAELPGFQAPPRTGVQVTNGALSRIDLILSTDVVQAPVYFGQPESPALIGTVRNPEGRSIPAVMVRITDQATSRIIETVTNESGVYAFADLPVGTYAVTVQTIGYETATPLVRIEGSGTVRIDIIRKPTRVTSDCAPLRSQTFRLRSGPAFNRDSTDRKRTTGSRCYRFGNMHVTFANAWAMLIITEQRLMEYTKRHPRAATSLFRWGALARSAKWRNLAETRRTFAHADQVGLCTVFNIKGNNYRLITRMDYGLQAITLKNFLAHAEYDRGTWKKDCQ